jgi:DNA polymerase-3 subunit epsilon
MASILESAEIKRYWPKFNYSQKHWEDVFGIFVYEDQNGYLRLTIEKNKKLMKPVFTFRNLTEGYEWLRKAVEENNLCPKLSFLQKGDGACSETENGGCKGACIKKENKSRYNNRVKKMIKTLEEEDSYAILDEGLQDDEKSCILVHNGRFFGMGYLPAGVKISDAEELKEYLTNYRENNYIKNLLLSYREKFPDNVLVLNCAETSKVKSKILIS